MSIREAEAKRLYDEGRECLFQKKFKQSVMSIQKAMQLYMEIGDLAMYVRAMNSLGVCYGVSGNETMAIDCYLNGLDMAKKYHIDGVSHLFYNNIGTRYQDLGAYHDSLEYYEKARNACNDDDGVVKEKETWYVVSCLNIALSHWYLKNYQESKKWLAMAKEKADKAEKLAQRLAALNGEEYVPTTEAAVEEEVVEEGYAYTKYTSDDGRIIKVTYEGGTTFILNYNNFEITVADGGKTYTIGALDFVKIK